MDECETATGRRHEGDGTGRAARSVLLWTVVEGGGLSAFGIVAVVVLARLIEPAQIGIAALALSIVQILNLLVELLFHDAIVQRKRLENAHLDTALWTSLGLGVTLAAGCWIAAPPVADAFGEPELAPVLAWMGLSLVFKGPTGVLTAKFRRDMRVRPVALRSLWGRLAGTMVAVGMAAAGFGVWSLVVQQLVASAAAALFICLVFPYRPGMNYSLARLRDLLSFAMPILLTQLVKVGSYHFFEMYVGYFLGTTVLGFLDVAGRIVGGLQYLLHSVGHYVGLSVFSSRQSNRPALRQACHRATEFGCLVAQPLLWGLIVCAEETISLLLGPQWLPAIVPMQILAVSAAIMLSRQFVETALDALGRPDLNLVTTGAPLAISAGALLVMGATTIVGVTLIWSARLLITLPLSFWFVSRFVGLSVREQLLAPAVPVSASLLMTAILYGAKITILSSLANTAMLAVLVPSGAVVYGIVVFVAAPTLARDFIGFVWNGIVRARPSQVTP